MQQFKDLGLSEEIVHALDEIGFETPTAIQAQAIPQLLEGHHDMIGLAQTGTGKTAAFGLPLLDLVDATDHSIQGVVLAPTRELVQQIALELQAFSKHKEYLHLTTVYGGTSISNQIKEIKKDKPAIIVATPGRLIDLIGRKVVKLHQLKYLVLDEADEMLNMGFQEEIDEILKFASEDKNTWLFSATMPKSVRRIVSNYMTDPLEIAIERKSITNENLKHKYVLVNRKDKLEALKRVIDFLPELYTVIFCRTKRGTQELADHLASEGYRADAIHGDLSQAQRDTVMHKFRSGSVNILVATDVAARGIDVNDLTHVIHYALPDNSEYYTHRSGRTARAGKEGVSLSIITPGEVRRINYFSKDLKIQFERVMIPRYMELLNKRILHWADNLKNIDETDVTAGILDKVISHIGDIDRDTLLAKLIARNLQQLKKLSSKDDLNAELNNKNKGKSDRGERKGKRKRDRNRDRDRNRGKGRDRDRRRSRERDSEPYDQVKMFINIGKMDGLGKKDLVSFISQHGGLSTGQIGDIRMQKMNTIFELNKEAYQKFTKKFKNVSFNGRDIRSNKK